MEDKEQISNTSRWYCDTEGCDIYSFKIKPEFIDEINYFINLGKKLNEENERKRNNMDLENMEDIYEEIDELKEIEVEESDIKK